MSEKKSMLDGEKQYHIQLKEGDIADFVFFLETREELILLHSILITPKKLHLTESTKLLLAHIKDGQ